MEITTLRTTAQCPYNRILHRGEHRIPSDLIERDFWLINDDLVVLMYYDEAGQFIGAAVADPDALTAHLHTRDAAWLAAEPFAEWWRRHPELHHRRVA